MGARRGERERERATCSLQFLRKHLQLTKADAEDNVLPNKPLFAHAVSHYASLPDLRCEHGDDEARLDSSMHVRCAHADGRMDAADTDSYAADGRAHRLRQRGGEDERGKEGGEIQESGGREGGRGDGPREEVNRKVGERSEGGRKTAVRQS